MSDDLLREERDQYASAIRHLLLSVRKTAHLWATTLPETVRTADVVKALDGVGRGIPQREDLRDDLWQRIVGAYYVRFQNDGHPEDSKAAADEAMVIVRPELDRLASSVQRVRDLHQYQPDADYCDLCSNHGDITWPCATIRALDSAEK